jgi:hypothetical protein
MHPVCYRAEPAVLIDASRRHGLTLTLGGLEASPALIQRIVDGRPKHPGRISPAIAVD